MSGSRCLGCSAAPVTDPQAGNSRAVVRIIPYRAWELLGTARVPSSHWLDASSTKGDTWDRGKQIPIPGWASGST